MADRQPVGGIYVYRGGRAPNNITHAIIDKSVKVIDEEAFCDNEILLSVKTHDELEEIGCMAFCGCVFLTHLDIRSVRILDSSSFADSGLTEMDCDNLEIIRDNAFQGCNLLRHIAFPKVKRIDGCAFEDTALTDVEFPETLELVKGNAFYGNGSLRRICLPLKADLFHEENPEDDEYFHPRFDECENLATVELIGGIHETVSSLHMKRWRNHMIQEMNQINVTLPRIPSAQKTNVIRWWLQSVHSRFEHYKTKHIQVLKEVTVLLELALWKARLDDDDDEGGDDSFEAPAKKVKVDVDRTRIERRITSGANIVIKNVLPFLELK
mmetsp:Transcript_21454/g.32129  ORF Transcript_21454/g.32129 Transcript_21454/m.32129 type:complete len:325 (+) Transcript_21454:95-1069(+)